MGYRYSNSRRRKRRGYRGHDDGGGPGLIEALAELFIEMSLLCVRSIARGVGWVVRKFRGAPTRAESSPNRDFD